MPISTIKTIRPGAPSADTKAVFPALSAKKKITMAIIHSLPRSKLEFLLILTQAILAATRSDINDEGDLKFAAEIAHRVVFKPGRPLSIFKNKRPVKKDHFNEWTK